MITETEAVKNILDLLRRLQGGEMARESREEIAEWIRSGNGPKIDLKAAEEVKYLGLVPPDRDE
jgi:hypothetical protein